MTVCLASGCGGETVPVAHVGGVAISNSAVEHWTGKLSATTSTGTKPLTQGSARCVHALSLVLRGIGDGGTPGGVACGDGSVGAHARQASALEFLITSTWLAKSLDDLRPNGGGGSKVGQLASVLRGHATTASAVELNKRLLASVAVSLEARANVLARRQVVAYYEQNATSFVGPEERDAEVIRTTTLQAGDKAKREIEAGDRFAEVAARVTVDATGKTNGGLVPAIVRSQEDPPLAKAVFSARLHMLIGPVMLEPHRFYLFRIKAIRPARDTTLAEFEASALERYRRAATAWLAGTWVAKLTASTDCRKGFVVEGCRQYAGAAGAGS